ncbi:hypothetical protein SNE40_008174 [Patella caerulea]|uniref:Schlafen family member 13-like n=1 Tax=Patella caerulea TaxID=87958 RepID=A0AAN8K0U6_PATCE
MLTATEITERFQYFGETVLQCTVHISKGIREGENNTVPKYVCALLNSGGGILQMKNEVSNRFLQSKDLDMWWSGMENAITDVLSGDDLCNYLDFVGNFDDKFLYLFVKSSEHLCTLNYHSRLPTETATHDVSHRSVIKLLSKQGQPGLLSDLPPIPKEYYYLQTEESLKQEGKQIQFKSLSTHNCEVTRSLPKRISAALSKYITAFANHEGGHIYFGIEDQRAEVTGEDLSPEQQELTVQDIQRRMNSVIWGESSFQAERGRHWDINFYPVYNVPYRARRMVVVVSVCKFPGGVFTTSPESYYVDSTGIVKKFTFDDWKSATLAEIRDKPELHSRFVKIPIPSPCSRLVFGLVHTIKTSREKHFKATTGLNVHPKHILDTIDNHKTIATIKAILLTFHAEPHLAIDIHSWGFRIPLSTELFPEKITSCVVFSLHYGVLLITFVKKIVKDKKQAVKNCQNLASKLKQQLVHYGGSCERIGISCHIVDISDELNLQNFQAEISQRFYPSTFSMDENKLDKLLDSAFVSIAAYLPHEAKTRHEEYYFLLTSDQFELLWSHQFTKELWIHGPPASGKTVSTLQMISELSRRGCTKSQILYLAENHLLCLYIRSFNICLVVNRRELMRDSHDPEIMATKYGQIKNVFIDEAQNFKDRDGDWYKLAEKLSKQNSSSSGTDINSGYFWMSMDYAQKVHKFKAGIPSLIGKTNFMLSEISRTSKEIFEYASKFMNSNNSNCSSDSSYMQDKPKLGHEFNSGHKVNVIHCDQKLLTETLSKVLGNFTSNGTDTRDMAILTGKKKDADRVQNSILPDLNRCDDRNGNDANIEDVTVESVRRFSGLDRPIIIGLDPSINEDHADLNKFIVNLSTRAKDGLVIITTSKDLLKKIQNLDEK